MSTPMPTIDPERLEVAKTIKLGVGCHSAPDNGTPCDMCVEEMMSWIAGLPWSDRPGLASPLIEAFCRSFNDRTDQDGRDALRDWKIANFDRLLRTVDDGHDQQRGFIGADYSIRHVLPLFLDLAGATDAAAELRGWDPITGATQAQAARDKIHALREESPLRGARQRLCDQVRAAVTERLKDHPRADAYAAAYAYAADAYAYAAYAADAYAAYAADAYAAYAYAAYAADAYAAYAADAYDAYAYAAYAADAYAAYAADAAAAYAADAAAAAADAAAYASGSSVYDAVYKAVKAKVTATLAERCEQADIPAAKDRAIAMLEQMVALGEGDTTNNNQEG